MPLGLISSEVYMAISIPILYWKKASARRISVSNRGLRGRLVSFMITRKVTPKMVKVAIMITYAER